VGPAAPAAKLPQGFAKTYLTLILYPAQLSAVGGLFPPQVAPSSKLYWILKPLTAAGGVTTIGPHVLTVGAAGIGKTATQILADAVV
jgi:hypothetical protein